MASWDKDYGYSNRSKLQQNQSLLQSVIRKLVDSIDDEERQQHYQEIQVDLSVAEENMNDLVDEHQAKLHSTLATFGKIDQTIKDSQAKVHMLKEHLQGCKVLLKCKREELNRLWLDDIKYKKMLKMIDNVDKMKHVPDQLQVFRNEKKYFEATELLKNSVAMMEGELQSVEALKDVRAEMKQQKETFHVEIIDELQKRLYSKAAGTAYQSSPPTAKKSAMLSSNSFSSSYHKSPSTPKKSILSGSSGSFTASKSSGGLLDNPSPLSLPAIDDTFEENVEPTEEDVANSQYLSSLVESLSMLEKVPEMIEAVQKRMKRELLLIVERTSIRVTQIAEEEGVSSSEKPSPSCTNPRYLRPLLDMCFRQFEEVVTSHRILLVHLSKAKHSFKAKYDLYSESDVWDGIQQVLRELLEVYLAVDEDKPQLMMNAYGAFNVAGHTAMFSRRKPQSKIRKQPLFKFDNSRHALSVSSYIKEQRDKELASQVKSGKVTDVERHTFEDDQPSISQHMVCRPSARNITVMYSRLKDFILGIEDAINLQQEAHCELYHFLQEFVEDRFLDSIAAEYREVVSNALKVEAKDSITMDQKQLRGSNKIALLNSVFAVWRALEELYRLMLDMPMFSSHFLSTIIDLLHTYFEDCQQMFHEHSATSGAPALHGHGDKYATHKLPVVSAKWMKDEGIVKLLKSLNSWSVLMKDIPKHKDPGVGKDSIHFKETENLMRTLSSEDLHRSDIIQDTESLKKMAVLHESMDWLGDKLGKLEGQLTEWLEETDGLSMSKALLKRHSVVEKEAARENDVVTKDLIEAQFIPLKNDVIHLSEVSILLLHLEVRIHCFYFMIPTLKNSNYVCENEVSDSDTGIKDLAADLNNMKMVTAGSLTADKQQYLFNGAGHLCSAIFISSTRYLKKININGVKKMCRNIHVMQSCLSKITSIREKDLDLAQKYFSMLYVNEEEFLKLVMEQGKVFTQADYSNALTLLFRSQAQQNEVRLQKNLGKLEQMFNDDAC